MGAPLALLAAVVALHAPPPATHDTLPVFLGDRGPVYMDYGVTPSLASHLHVFHVRTTAADLLPRPILVDEPYDYLFNPYDARLLAPHLWGVPQRTGSLCFWPLRGWGYCVDRLVHGAYPFVDARYGAVYGLLSNRVMRVTVNGRPVQIGRNGFYVRARRVRRVVVTDRDGKRHLYTFFACAVIDYNDFVGTRIAHDPLYPVPDYCY